MHAQALTIAVLSGAALMHYYDKNTTQMLSGSDQGENEAPVHFDFVNWRPFLQLLLFLFNIM